jgi:hypothetical protein
MTSPALVKLAKRAAIEKALSALRGGKRFIALDIAKKSEAPHTDPSSQRVRSICADETGVQKLDASAHRDGVKHSLG